MPDSIQNSVQAAAPFSILFDGTPSAYANAIIIALEKQGAAVYHENADGQDDFLQRVHRRKWSMIVTGDPSLAMADGEMHLRKALDEKNILLRELHHRVKNNMQIIVSLLEQQKRRVQSTFAVNALSESQQRIGIMAAIHETLLQAEDMSEVHIKTFMRILAKSVSELYGSVEREIDILWNIVDITMSVQQAVPFGLIANELISNAYQHAFTNVKKGCIRINLTRDKESVELEIIDDGVGMPRIIDHRSNASMGFTVINALTRQLRGVFDVHRGKGTRCVVRFPLEYQ